MAISLGDIKKKKITVSPIKNTNTNNTAYNVAPPVNNQREQQTYNLGDVKNNNITVPLLSERPKSKILAPSPQETMTINSINNKINENISKQIVSGGIQNDIHNMNMANIGAKSNKVTFESVYKDTGKKYGDYYYDNYESFKNKPIYERDGKYFLKTNKGYEPIGKLDKDGNVKTDIEFEKKDNSISKDKKFTKNQDVNLISKYEDDKKELEKAESLGYKDNLTKITSKEYDKAQKVLKEYKKQMQLSDKDYDKWFKTGKLPKKHGYFLDGDKTPEKAEDYRVKLLNGEIKKYDQQGFDVEKQIYMDTHNMSDEQKQQYISFITGKNTPTPNTKSTFFKSSESDNPVGTTLGTIGHAATTLAKGIGNFIEGGGDFALNLLGSSMETSAIASIGNKKKDVTTIKNNVEYTGYQLDNKKYWYDKKNDKLYDENWNRIQSFNLDRFQKQYTYSNGIAEFGRQTKEQTVKDDTSEAFDEVLHGNDLRKASVLGNKSEAMLESLGQALPMMGAGGSVEGLYGAKAAVATTSGLTFSSTYGNAKTEAIRNGATEKEAMETAFVQASAETISEQFFDAIPWAKSAGWGKKLVGKVGNGVEKYLGSKTAKIVTKALDISGEGFEEIISNMLTAGGNDIVHYFDKDYNYGMENQTGNILEDMKNAMTSQDSMDSFISAIITSALLNGGSAKVNSTKINKIVKTYAQEYNMSIEEAKARLKISDDKIEFDTSNINQTQNTPNLPNKSVVEQRNINNNINNQVNENIQNGMVRTQNNANEKYSTVNPPMVIEYQETNNQKINKFRQSAVKEGMLNSKKTTDAMNVIEKIIQDKDYNVKFDRTITNLEGKSVDGKININKNGEVEIALNPNSDRAVEFLLTHEVTHAIETKELRGIILDYANKNSEFKSALQDLQKTYGTINVNDEVIADISGQILGNQEFINSLSMQNTEQARGIIKNIYHSIQRLLNKLTTKGRYRNFVEDLETKWREAYRLATNETVQENLKNDIFEKIYEKKERGTGNSTVASSFSDNNVPQFNKNVKSGTSTKYSMQIKENNTQELDNSPFSLQKRYDDIINQREYLRQEIQKLRKQKEEIIKEIPNYSIFKKYDELTGIDKLINENLEETKKLYNQKQELKEKIDIIKETQNQKEIDEINKNGSPLKREQLNIINQTNPMLDDLHVGIRNVADIKTFDEVINDEESFAWGDYTKDDAIRDLKNGYVTVYSSYPIENGVFVSTSYQQAFEYAGHDKSKVHQKKVPLNEVAWINGDEGQYAKVEDTKYSQESSTWKEHLDKNYKPTGTRIYFDEITNKKIAPINHNATTNQNRIKPPIAKEYQKNVIEEKIEKSDNVPDVLKISGDSLIEQSSNLTNDDIAKILTEEPETENTKNKRKLAILGAQLLDKGLVFENLSLKTKNRDLMGKWDYTLTSEARGQNVIGNGHYEFDSKTKTKKQTSKSLYDIQKEVNNSRNTKEFYEYLYHKHNIDRMSLQDKYGIDNKPVFGDNIDAEYSKNIVNEYEKNYPQFTDYAQDIYDYLNADRQELVKSGVITQELADYWQEMYPHYVPIRRENTFGNAIDVPLDTKRTSINAPIKKAKGGNQNILPLFDTIAKRTLQTYRAVAKNNFGIELKNTLNTSLEATDTNVDDVINNIDFQNELLNEGKNGSNPTFTVFENGKKVTFEITKDMYDALKPVSESSILSKTFKPFNKAMSIYRGILTEYNPVFMLTNSIKDAQDVLINSQHSAKTYKTIPEAYKQILSKGYWYQEYVSNGGEQNSYFDNWKNKFVKDEQNVLGRIIKWPFKKVSQANNVIEMAPRLAEYIASRQDGRSIETSMLDAARVTTNFKAGGDATKFVNRNGGIFLNASVQGLMQNVRNVREARANGLKGWTNLATKCIIAGIPALILNNLAWDDDDDYNELSDYVKDNYYIIAKYGDDKFIRIPKGRTIAVIQNAFTQVADSTTGNDKADLDRFLNLATSNLAPNNPIENNIFSPIIQVLSNKTWYGDDLVPQRLQSSPNKQQYDETTDSFSKWLGNKLNISPYKIHYLLDQYSGGVGDVVLPMMTPEAENGSDSLRGKVIAPLIDKFTADSVMDNKYKEDFYDVKDKATKKAHSIDANEKDILMSKYLNSKNFYLNQLYAEKRTIQNSKLKDSEKYKKVKEKQDEINKLAKQSIDEYKKVKIGGSTATVGDIKYRKDKNGEWTKVKDK